MNADPNDVQRIFARAIEIEDNGQRQAYIITQCGQDAGLLLRVQALMSAYQDPKPFFDQPTAELADHANFAPGRPSETAQKAGSLVAGRYKLLEDIGEGGMRTVWVAEQTTPVRRKVALKPSNVLICLYDGQPVPKVIDFGLAKAMYQPLTEHTLHTANGLTEPRINHRAESVRRLTATAFLQRTTCDSSRHSRRTVPVCRWSAVDRWYHRVMIGRLTQVDLMRGDRCRWVRSISETNGNANNGHG